MAPKRKKTKNLDTFTSQAGYGKKYAIHIPAREGKTKPAGKRVRLKASAGSGSKRVYPRIYDRAVQNALYPSGRRLTINAGSCRPLSSMPISRPYPQNPDSLCPAKFVRNWAG